MGSGERATVSICVSCDITSVEVVSIRPVVSSHRTERSVGSARVSGFPSEDRRSEDGFKSYNGLLHKHAKKGLAIFNPSEVAGLAYNVANCLPESCETVLRRLEGFCTH